MSNTIQYTDIPLKKKKKKKEYTNVLLSSNSNNVAITISFWISKDLKKKIIINFHYHVITILYVICIPIY
jgi:hypothetical protein